METYVAFIRGINVGGKKPLKMKALVDIFFNLGFKDTRTYLQSGNVVFQGQEADLSTLETLLEDTVNNEFNYDVKVLLLKAESLKDIIDHNPLTKDSQKRESYFHVTFLASKPENFDEEEISKKMQVGEETYYGDGCIYLYCPHGYGKTKLNNNFFEKKLNVSATTRNWKTLQAVNEMTKAF